MIHTLSKIILGIIDHCEIHITIESFLCEKTWIKNWRKNRHLPSLGGVPDPWLAPMAVRSWLTGRLGVFVTPCLTMALPGGAPWGGEGPFGLGLIKFRTSFANSGLIPHFYYMCLKHVITGIPIFLQTSKSSLLSTSVPGLLSQASLAKIPQKCKQTSPVHRALFRNCFCRSF